MEQGKSIALAHISRMVAFICLPAGGADESEGDELVPERVILRYGLWAYQSLETAVISEVTDLAGVGSHLYWLGSARSSTRHCYSPCIC